MARLNVLLLFFCAIGCTLALENDKSTTSTTTPSSTTISSSSTSTTVAPKTTTSTTESTTTTTSTTETPTTTISPVPTTTTEAPPLPAPEVGEWNSTCIKLKFAAQLSFSYQTLDNKTKQITYNLPAGKISKYDDDCNLFNETESISLDWVDGKTKEQNNIKFVFYKSEKTVSLGLIHINLVPSTLFPDANNNSIQLIFNRNSTFVTPLHMSYHCTRAQTFNLTEVYNSSNVTGTITLSNVQLEAFHNKDDKKPLPVADAWSFSDAKDCDANNTPDIVPIAVGIALSALILIVFISYLVARSNNRGYMSF